jgi:Flp pilus assembly protein TadD
VDLDALRQIDSLASLPRHQLARVSQRLHWRRYAPGELILPHQVRMDLEGLVYRGQVQIATVEQGRRKPVGRLSAGEPISGDLSACYSSPIELRAIQPTILCLLPSASLQRLTMPSAPTQPPISPSAKGPYATKLGAQLRAPQVVLVSLALLFGLLAWRWQSPWRTLLSNLAYGLASQRLEARDETEALSLLQISLALNPSLARAHNDLGYIYYRQGQQNEAQIAFIQASALDPTLAVAQNNLGLSYLESGQLDAARAALRQAVTLNPESAAAWTNLGVTEQLADRSEEAIQAYRAALRLDPHNILARVNLGVIYYEQNRFSEAQFYLEASLAAQPDLNRARAVVGAIALSQGDHARAWSEFQAVTPKLADEPLLHFYLALWYEDKQIWDKAQQELMKALELQPHPDLAELIQSHMVALDALDSSLSTVDTETKADTETKGE